MRPAKKNRTDTTDSTIETMDRRTSSTRWPNTSLKIGMVPAEKQKRVTSSNKTAQNKFQLTVQSQETNKAEFDQVIVLECRVARLVNHQSDEKIQRRHGAKVKD